MKCIKSYIHLITNLLPFTDGFNKQRTFRTNPLKKTSMAHWPILNLDSKVEWLVPA